MEALARDHDLIVCVDCGTLSHGPIAAAKGADVVVLDHHLGAETLPDAHAVVNPNRQDEDGSIGTSGVPPGLCFWRWSRLGGRCGRLVQKGRI